MDLIRRVMYLATQMNDQGCEHQWAEDRPHKDDRRDQRWFEIIFSCNDCGGHRGRHGRFDDVPLLNMSLQANNVASPMPISGAKTSLVKTPAPSARQLWDH